MTDATGVTEQDLLAAADRGDLVLTVNRRLARYLVQAYDAQMRIRGRTVWKAPSIVFHQQWQRRLAERLGLDRRMLSSAQMLVLWERAIREEEQGSGADELMRIADAARTADAAHRLLCDYDVSFTAQEGSDDHRAFLRWRRRWQQLCEGGGWQDPALLGRKLVKALETARASLPGTLWLAGFDELTPIVEALIQVLEHRGVSVFRWQSPCCPSVVAGKVSYADCQDELRQCAGWVRRLLEQSRERIGIVVFDMNSYQRPLQRIFREELTPAALLPDADNEKAFNLSLGTPLAQEPMILAAFELLALGRSVALDRLGFLLRSPFVWGHSAEEISRALLDRELRALRMKELPLRQVLQFAEQGFKKGVGQSDIFARQLAIVLESLEDRELCLPGAWAIHFAELLDRCQWSRDRTLSSREYQVYVAWKELLAGLGGLDGVSNPMPRSEALALLRRQAGEMVFQPEGSMGRVQVLGPLEAGGMQFDALWLVGAHDEVLPAAARPNPFLPPALQRRLNMPHADPSRELEYGRILARRLLGAAPEVVISWPRQMEGRERLPSPLFAHLPQVVPSVAESRRPARLLRLPTDCLECFEDDVGPALSANERVAGGAAILKDQALCPFRAFARHRLGARALESPGPGLDGLDRGALVHRVLELFWNKTGDWRTLVELDPQRWKERAQECVGQALAELERQRRVPLSSSQRRLESARLESILGEWLEVEASRPSFSVVSLESWHRQQFGPLLLQTRIDRIDRLADGTQVIIDYKTGQTSLADWLGERPTEPQLPLYTLSCCEELLGALAFARVRRGECALVGLGCRNDLLPGVDAAAGHRQLEARGVADWSDLLRRWRQALQGLAGEFCAGQAVVQPLNEQHACAFCDLHALCRVADRDQGLDQGGTS